MIKHSVKKPYTILVSVVLIIILGIVSFTKLTTDLLPSMSLPYILVITTYPGASPEKVEADISEPLESALGTVNGVENVTSMSNENYSLVYLEFTDDTNMDSAMVKVSTKVNQMEFPDICGNPTIMEISPDLMATLYAGVTYDGKDIYEISDFTNEVVAPYLERQAGVASVDKTGIVEKSVEIRLDQDKIDVVNAKVQGIAVDKLDDAQKEIDDAKQELEDAKDELEDGKKKLESEQTDKSKEIAEYSKQLDEAMATKASYNAQLTALKADKMALETEKKAYEDNQVKENYENIKNLISTIRSTISSDATYQQIYNMIYAQVKIATVQQALENAGITGVVVDAGNVDTYLDMLGDAKTTILETVASIAKLQTETQIAEQLANLPISVKDAIDNPAKLEYLKQILIQQGQPGVAEQLTKENLETMYNIVEIRMPQMETGLANLEIEIQVAEMAVKKINEAIAVAENAYTEVEIGKITAAAAFGAYTAQIESGKTQIETGEDKLKEAQDTLDESRENVMKTANLNALLTMDTLSAIITAQNFSMPAGYIDNGDDSQVLVKIGDEYNEVEQLEDMILTHIDSIGDIKLSDVAYITVIDNANDSYAKIDGSDAVILSVNKVSTAGTSTVSKNCNQAIKELEAKYEGLHITKVMDQGDYIGLIINSVLSNLIWGALLAIIVLAIFMKDIRPTMVVALSIPMSVLTAIVLMYFSGMTLNIISLSGLALGIGMLVDNSIVVIENIYRLRSKGVPAARAAVMGTKQVAGAIAASTLTTVSVFLPIVFTEGLTRQLFTDLGLTITYSLVASLAVALTFIPALSSTVLKNTKEKEHKIFDKFTDAYGKALAWCLKVKIVPIAVAVGLLAMCVVKVFSTGLILLPEMGGNQMSVTVNVPEDVTVSDGYASMDDLIEKFSNIEGVQTVGAMSGGGSGGSLLLASGSNRNMSLFIILEDEQGKDNVNIAKKISEILNRDYPDYEATVSTSNMDISMLFGSGIEIDVYGDDLDDLVSISNDMTEILGSIEGFENISNGQEAADRQLQIAVDKDKAMQYNLTVAQIYQEIAGALTTEKDSVTLTTSDEDMKIVIVDETNKITEDNLMDYEFEVTTTDEDGKEIEETHKLSEFAALTEGESIAKISRENQERYISVTADTMDGYNTTLLSRTVEEKLEGYEVKEGNRIVIAGESEQVIKMIKDMILMIALAVAFIYLIMVAQFQSLLSPFIVLFTLPLAFTGGFVALMITGVDLSMIAMMGFLILAGVVVNNGIVFVDYTNQLRAEGVEKREALIETGKTRMRPILMTAMTTILAMATLALSRDASAVMSKGMVTVAIGGLAYATIMTLIIVPVMYDILYRRDVLTVDVGNEDDWEEK